MPYGWEAGRDAHNCGLLGLLMPIRNIFPGVRSVGAQQGQRNGTPQVPGPSADGLSPFSNFRFGGFQGQRRGGHTGGHFLQKGAISGLQTPKWKPRTGKRPSP